MATSFSGGGSRREPPILGKQLVIFITCGCESSAPFYVIVLDLTTHTSLSSIRRGFTPNFVNYIKGCTRLAAASDKDYQLLAQDRWFSPASSVSLLKWVRLYSLRAKYHYEENTSYWLNNTGCLNPQHNWNRSIKSASFIIFVMN
jgi:hypothetical protein